MSDKAARVAAEWDVPEVYASPEELFDHVDAVIVASSNASHHPIALAAMERDLHVLCEKPLGLDAAQANELAAAAERHGAITMTPFTYRFMPMARQLRHHIDNGYIGTPFHLAARYYTGFARDGEYAWRFDLGESGSGVLGDIGSHWIDLATYLLGDIAEVGCVTNATVAREPRPDGLPYEAGEDVALTTLRFTNGAIGHLIVSAVCWEGHPSIRPTTSRCTEAAEPSTPSMTGTRCKRCVASEPARPDLRAPSTDPATSGTGCAPEPCTTPTEMSSVQLRR